MIRTKRVGLFAGAAALTLTGGSFADTSLEDQNNELRSRIAELENRLNAVEVQNGDNWLTEQRAEEIRGLVTDVLADADTRSSMLAQGMTAGYDDGAVIASADGNWMLRTNIHLQTRFMINAKETATTDATGAAVTEDTLWGFEVTRAKFILTGNVVSPEWYYKVEIETSGNNVGATGDARGGLQDAYIGYDFGNGFKLQAGSMKVPFLYEELVDSRYQQMVERSYVNYLYTASRSDGLMLEYMGDQFGVKAMWDNGTGATIFGAGPGAALVQDTDFAFAIRADWLAMGTWEQFKDITSPRGEEMGLKVGGAVRYQAGQGGAAGGTSTDITQLTIDASWEGGGWNLLGAFTWSDVDAAGAAADLSPLALLFQGGYYLTEDWEIFGRVEWSDTDVTGADDITLISGGVTKYFAGHNAKWTTDLGFSLENLPTTVQSTGYIADAVMDDSQFVLRTQLQIVF